MLTIFKIITVSLFITGAVYGADGTEIPLWPSGAPGSEGMTGKEIVEAPAGTRDHYIVHNIHNPSIAPFLAPREIANGTGVVIAPGGGHRFLSIDIEGYNVAKYLNSIGVSAFVLKYRLAREEGSPYKVEVHELQDAQRAIRLVRCRATEWGVNPSRIAIMGFSAGGELAARASMRFDSGNAQATDAVDRQSSRPDFQILIYPGGDPSIFNFTKDSPPAFLLGADNDPLTARNAPVIYEALKKVGVPTEMHIYVDGGHGFGIREHPKQLPSTTTWYLRLRDWMDDRGLLKKQ
jgi:acetyl esterase/lipase